MDKLKLIRENEQKFKQHLQNIQDTENQKKDSKLDAILMQANISQQQHNEAERYLMNLRQKAQVENSNLLLNQKEKSENNNNKLHQNLNNFVFDQIYDESDNEKEADYQNDDNLLFKKKYDYLFENKNENNFCSNNNNDVVNIGENLNSKEIIEKPENNNYNNCLNNNYNEQLKEKDNNVFISFGLNKNNNDNNYVNQNRKKLEQINSSNEINNFINDLNSKLNINVSNKNANSIKDNSNINNNQVGNIPEKKHKNLGKMIENYLEYDDPDENLEILNQKIFNNQPYTPNFKFTNNYINENCLNLNDNNQNNNYGEKINNNNILYPQDDIVKITPKNIRNITEDKIKKACDENRNKKAYTAYTYSNIQKIKEQPKKNVKSKSLIFYF